MDMTAEQEQPERLELAIHRSSPWPYILLGALFGAGIEILVILPLDAVFRNLFEYIFAGNHFRLHHALGHLARPGEWPAVSLTGFIFGAALGFVFYRLKENQKRLQSLHQEFEIQVATLRHHYKNLALGINGFSARARRKLEKLQPHLHDCAFPDADLKVEIDAWSKASLFWQNPQRLSAATEELVLKALESNAWTIVPRFQFAACIQSFGCVSGKSPREITASRWRTCAPLVFARPICTEVICRIF
jgi:hypothetical protein